MRLLFFFVSNEIKGICCIQYWEYIQAIIFVWSVKFYLHKYFVSIYCPLVMVNSIWSQVSFAFFPLVEHLLSGKIALAFFVHFHGLRTNRQCCVVWTSRDEQKEEKKKPRTMIWFMIIWFTGRLLQYFGFILFLLHKLT